MGWNDVVRKAYERDEYVSRKDQERAEREERAAQQESYRNEMRRREYARKKAQETQHQISPPPKLTVKDPIGTTRDMLKKASEGNAYIGKKLYAGMLGGIEDAGKFIKVNLAKGAEFLTGLGGLAKNPVSEALGKYVDWELGTDTLNSKMSKAADEEYDAPQWYKTYVGGAFENAGRMAPTILATILSGGAAGAASSAGEIGAGLAPAFSSLSAAEKISKATDMTAKAAKSFFNPGSVLFGLGAAGSAAQEGYRVSGDAGKSLKYGALSGLTEMATERLFGGFAGTEVGESAIEFTVKNPALRKALDIGSEGIEEMISTFADPYTRRATVDPDAKNASLSEYGESAVQGVLLAGLMGAASYPVKKHQTESAAKTLNSSLDALKTVMPDAQYPEPLNPGKATLEQVENRQKEIKNLTQTYQKVYQNRMNQKLDSLLGTMKTGLAEYQKGSVTQQQIEQAAPEERAVLQMVQRAQTDYIRDAQKQLKELEGIRSGAITRERLSGYLRNIDPVQFPPTHLDIASGEAVSVKPNKNGGYQIAEYGGRIYSKGADAFSDRYQPLPDEAKRMFLQAYEGEKGQVQPAAIAPETVAEQVEQLKAALAERGRGEVNLETAVKDVSKATDTVAQKITELTKAPVDTDRLYIDNLRLTSNPDAILDTQAVETHADVMADSIKARKGSGVKILGSYADDLGGALSNYALTGEMPEMEPKARRAFVQLESGFEAVLKKSGRAHYELNQKLYGPSAAADAQLQAVEHGEFEALNNVGTRTEGLGTRESADLPMNESPKPGSDKPFPVGAEGKSAASRVTEYDYGYALSDMPGEKDLNRIAEAAAKDGTAVELSGADGLDDAILFYHDDVDAETVKGDIRAYYEGSMPENAITNDLPFDDVKFSIEYNNNGTPALVVIEDDIFKGHEGEKPHKVIRDYLRQHIGEYATIIESGQKVYFGKDLPGEYTQSNATRKLDREGHVVKNQAAQNLNEMVEIGTNRRWNKNVKEKHNIDAKYGFYKYFTRFKVDGKIYSADVLIRNDANGKKYLYDIVNIKKDRGVSASNHQKDSSAVSPNPFITNTISQKDSTVKNSIRESGGNDTKLSADEQETGKGARYNEGRAGDVHTDGDLGRASGADSDKPIREVAEWAEASGEAGEGREGTSRARRIYAKNAERNGQVEKRVFRAGRGAVQASVIAKEAYNAEMKEIAARNAADGIETEFFSGGARAAFTGGKSARGVLIDGKTMLIQYDHPRFSPEQIQRHELTHKQFESREVQRIKNVIANSFSVAERRKIARELYRDYYALTDGNEAAVFEEFICDVMAGMNEYSGQFEDAISDYWRGESAAQGYDAGTYTESIDAGPSADSPGIGFDSIAEPGSAMPLPGGKEADSRLESGRMRENGEFEVNRSGELPQSAALPAPSAKREPKTLDQGRKREPKRELKKFSIEYTTENAPAVVVDENILDGVPKSKWISEAKKALTKFSEGIPVGGRLIKVNKISRNEYVASKYSKNLKQYDGAKYSDKLNASGNADEIVLASANYINEDLKHERKDNFIQFARGDVLLQIGDRQYDAKVIVGFTSGNEMVLYDVVDMKETDFDIKKSARSDGQSAKQKPIRTDLTDVDTTISQDTADVNSSIRKTAKNDTDLKLSLDEDGGTGYLSEPAEQIRNDIEEVRLRAEARKGKVYTRGDIRQVTASILENLDAGAGRGFVLSKRDQSAMMVLVNRALNAQEPEVRERAWKGAASYLAQHALVQDSSEYFDYRGTLSHVRDLTRHAIRLTDTDRAELDAMLGEASAGYKALFGGGSRGVDEVYSSLSLSRPDLFPPENTGGQLRQIVETYQFLKEGAETKSERLLDVMDADDRKRFAELVRAQLSEASETQGRPSVLSAELQKAEEKRQADLNRMKERYEKKIADMREKARDRAKSKLEAKQLEPMEPEYLRPKNLTEAAEKHGRIKPGERPARDIAVPKKISRDQYVSRMARTMLEAGVTPAEAVSEFEERILDGTMTYERVTDKSAKTWVDRFLRGRSFPEALKYWNDLIDANARVDKNHMALGMTLYNQCVNAKDAKTAMKLAADLARTATQAGQTVQAVRLLKQMSPDAQLYDLEQSVDRINADLKKRLGKKYQEIGIDEKLAQEYLTAESEEQRDEVMERITAQVAAQIPATVRDKLDAWRYLSMLANPRTHIRNIVGNAVFVPAVELKNAIGAAMEQAIPKEQRTKAVTRAAGTVEFASRDFKNIEKAAAGNSSRFNEMAEGIENQRTIFKTKPLEKLRKLNFDLLELEDVVFLKRAYVSSLSGAMTARGYTPEFLSSGTLEANQTLEKLRDYAILEAQRATYRDANALAKFITQTQRKARNSKNAAVKAGGLLFEGLLPFKTTPLNILRRGLEYSPVGLVKGGAEILQGIRTGEWTPAQAIDDLAKGFSGSILVALGALLCYLGLIKGAGSDDDKAERWQEAQGYQNYALKLGDSTYTIDWMAPASLPLFVGVELMKMLDSGKGIELSSVLDALTKISDPMMELSVLQGVSSAIKTAGYSEQNALSAVATDMVISYFGQYVPTFLGQVARTVDKTRRSTYIEPDSDLPRTIDNFIQRMEAKLPFVSYRLQPRLDAWGREQTNGDTAAERALANFISPGYYKESDSTRVDQELNRLYEKTGDNSLLPAKPQKYFSDDGERINLTGSQYTKLCKIRGQEALKELDELIASQKYQNKDDGEKAKAIQKIYDDAKDKAKNEILKEMGR